MGPGGPNSALFLSGMVTRPPDELPGYTMRSLRMNIAVHARGRKKVPNETGYNEISFNLFRSD